jgi:hypothetical protein
VPELLVIWNDTVKLSNALRLFMNGGKDRPTSRVQSFGDFALAVGHGKWSSPAALILINSSTCPQRVQETGTCAWHASIACAVYVERRYEKNASMLDLTHYVLHGFKKGEIETIVINDGGIKPEEVLEDWFGPANIGIGALSRLDAATLNLTGPVVITNFVVHEDFDKERPSYLGTVSGNETGLHAMLIVGVREEAGEKIFLVQNWRPDMQFVEMSEGYLLSAGVAGYYFVRPGARLRQGISFGTSHLRVAVSALWSRVRSDAPRG